MADSAGLDIHNKGGKLRADGHAPIGVMGDHMHKAGEFMLSYRYMRMDMEDNLNGSDEISAETIATTILNPFAATAGQPPTLRVVPTRMKMDMHMVGAMYAPTDWLTLMGMGMWQSKEMDHITFAGGAGTTRLGEFTTRSDGLGDTRVTAMLRAYEMDGHHVHINVGLSLPTGSIEADDAVLAPNGSTPTLRLPYPMQLGSGTFDVLPGVTYTGHADDFGWGAQYAAVLRTADNGNGYHLGDEHTFTAWGSYQWRDWVSTSVRLTAMTKGVIEGLDPDIVAPVQTADPNNQGGERLDPAIGANFAMPFSNGRNGRFAIEAGIPPYQAPTGPPLQTDSPLTPGPQFALCAT